MIWAHGFHSEYRWNYAGIEEQDDYGEGPEKLGKVPGWIIWLDSLKGGFGSAHSPN